MPGHAGAPRPRRTDGSGASRPADPPGGTAIGPTDGAAAEPVRLDRRADERRTVGLLDSLLAEPTTRVLDVAGERLLASAGATGQRRLALRRPRAGEATDALRHVYLGRDDDGTAYVAALHPVGTASGVAPPADPSRDAGVGTRVGLGPPEWAGLRQVGSWLPGVESDLAMTAVGLARWHERHGYCPACGSPTELAAAGWVRRCVAEGTEHHPRTDPAVMVAIVDPDDRLLLARGPAFRERWVSVLAGFVEPGETLEGAVAREMAEEVGVVLQEVTYVVSQPWPFPAALMVGFTARTMDSTLRLDPAEIAEADWYPRDRLAAELASGRLGIPGRFSIARRLIEDWYGGPVRQYRAAGTSRTDRR